MNNPELGRQPASKSNRHPGAAAAPVAWASARSKIEVRHGLKPMLPERPAKKRSRSATQRGSVLVEFALIGLMLVLVIFALIEFSRMLLVYTSLTSTARIAARYAIVHGSKRTGTGSAGPSGPSTNPPEIVSLIESFSRVGLADPTRLIISVTYPDGSNAPGSRVKVTVKYPYDPWVALPLSVTLGGTSQGVITF